MSAPGVTDPPGAFETQAVENGDRVVHVSFDIERLTHRRRSLAALLIAEGLKNLSQLDSQGLRVIARKPRPSMEEKRRWALAKPLAGERSSRNRDFERFVAT